MYIVRGKYFVYAFKLRVKDNEIDVIYW